MIEYRTKGQKRVDKNKAQKAADAHKKAMKQRGTYDTFPVSVPKSAEVTQ